MGLNKLPKMANHKAMVDGKKILAELDVERKPYTFSLKVKLMDDFKDTIGKAKQNEVLERIIKDFLDSLKK